MSDESYWHKGPTNYAPSGKVVKEGRTGVHGQSMVGMLSVEQYQEAAEIAGEILKLTRSRLLISLRFMEPAFLGLLADPDLANAAFATEGQFLHYGPAFIVRLFSNEQTEVTRSYLHTVLHCVYRHFFVGKKIDQPIWDLACDIAVESQIESLGLPSTQTHRSAEQRWLISQLEDELPSLTAERIYKYFKDQDLIKEEAAQLRRPFMADDHGLWYSRTDGTDKGSRGSDEEDEDSDSEETSSGDSAADQGPSEDEEGEQSGDESNEAAVEGTSESGVRAGAQQTDDSEANVPTLAPDELNRKWEEIGERIQVDLETHPDSWGTGSGNFRQALKEINRERYDYADFLKRFSSTGENMQVNDDEFDYIYYDFGMRHYGNMPLIEPLEYKEVKRVREFVIALDTSESVSGDLVQEFVQKTWNIMKQTDSFFTTVNIHIIQCGAKVEEDAHITNQDEFDDYMRTMVLKGFGGTDFRPVFRRVDELIENHAFMNLKGLIYFTDGYGTYPAMPPAYETAFVFVDRGQDDIPEVPTWAMRLVLKEEEIHELDAC